MTKRQWSGEEKRQIIMAGLKSESTVGELCRRTGIHQNRYYHWKQQFLEGGLAALKGNGKVSTREAMYQRENEELRQIIGDLTIENRLLKKMQK